MSAGRIARLGFALAWRLWMFEPLSLRSWRRLFRRIKWLLSPAPDSGPGTYESVAASLAIYKTAMDILKWHPLLDIVEDYRRVSIIAPDRIKLYGDELLAVDLAKVRALLETSIEKECDFAEGHFALGSVLSMQGHTEQAIAAFLLAAASTARSPPPPHDVHVAAKSLHEAGVLLSAQGSLDQALSCQHQALILQCDMVRAHLAYADLLQARGQFIQAADHYALYMRASIELPGEGA